MYKHNKNVENVSKLKLTGKTGIGIRTHFIYFLCGPKLRNQNISSVISEIRE